MNEEEAQDRWIWKVESNFSSKSCFDSLKEEEDESVFARSNAKRKHLGGGLKWPSRSYCCNFCTREFRSAQALGGHMNVHRSDKARLKLHNQSPICHHRSAEKQHRTDLCVGSKKPSTDDEVALALQLLNRPASFISEHGFQAGTRTEDLDLELRL